MTTGEIVIASTELLESEQAIVQAAASYDLAECPGLEYLRPHQIMTLEATLSYIKGLSHEDLQASEGACILMPTGSGKTISAASIVTALTTENYRPKVLHLVPSLVIQEGTKDDFETFAPTADAFMADTYKEPDGNVCIMTYQSLDSAIKSGYVDQFAPDLIIADEAHHIIDGVWAQNIANIAPGRVSIGMTATPAYNRNRNVRALFPEVLVHKTLKEGIDEGFVGPFKSFMYKSNVRDAKDTDGITRDMLEALSITARYAALGKIGLLSCLPGDDRAQSRAIQSLAPMFQVGGRSLRVESVHGDMPRSEVRAHIKALRQGEIDAVAYTRLLGEGFDLPELDYMILLSWTQSMVYAAQRLGRATRLGKVTDVHEFHRPDRISHLDAYNEKFEMGRADRESLYITVGQLLSPIDRDDELADSEDVGDEAPGYFDYDSLLKRSEQIMGKSEDIAPVAESSVVIGGDNKAISFKWKTKTQIKAELRVSDDDIDEILNSFETRTISFRDFVREYYPPEAEQKVMEAMDVQPFDPDTHVPAMQAYRRLRSKMRWVGGYSSFLELLARHDVIPEVFVDSDGQPILAVKPEAFGVMPELPEAAARSLANLAARRREIKLPAQKPVAPKPNGQLKATQTEKKNDKPLKDRLEDFLLSLGEQPDETDQAKALREARMTSLRRVLATSSTITRAEIKRVLDELGSLAPDSLLLRNAESMGSRLGLRPAIVLVALNRANSHSL